MEGAGALVRMVKYAEKTDVAILLCSDPAFGSSHLPLFS
jgi:hypothetical protein